MARRVRGERSVGLFYGQRALLIGALELLAVAAAGAAAGASNSIAGAGSLITFPTMVALGLPPLSAHVTHTVGIVPGYVGGVLGSRDLLRQQGERFARLLVPMLVGAVAG